MFSIFNGIDSKLFVFFQWVVRQFELYTKVTRKNIVTFNSSLLALSLLTLLLLIVYMSLLAFSTGLYGGLCALFILLAAVLFTFASILPVCKKNSTQGVIPEELVTRKRTRVRIIFILIFFILISIFQRPEKFNWFIAAYSILIFSYLLSLFCLEYFVCTLSIRVDEKA